MKENNKKVQNVIKYGGHFSNVSNIKEKITRKYDNHEEQTSRCTKERRDEGTNKDK